MNTVHAMHMQKAIVLLFLLTLVLSDVTNASSYRTITGQLNLHATVHGEPAFRPVVWQLRRLSANTVKSHEIGRRHSVVVDLEAGTYIISVTLESVTKTQEITIREGEKHELTINMW